MAQDLILYVFLINVIAYTTMWWDKYLSKKKGFRIPERTLFLMAIFLGSVGIYLGMKTPIYHKAAKPKFKIGIPVLIVLHIVLIFLWNYFFLASK